MMFSPTGMPCGRPAPSGGNESDEVQLPRMGFLALLIKDFEQALDGVHRRR